MKRPSFQFYPGDWQVNSNLRRCSHAEKGVWLDIMCLFHDAAEYGVLRWPLKEIAQAVGASVALVKGLVTKGVLKGDDKHLNEPYIYTPRSGRKDGEPITLLDTQDGPVWYSSRMVKDEYVRTIRGESSRFGADEEQHQSPKKSAPKLAPKPPFGDGSSSSSSSSFNTNTPSTAMPDQPELTPEQINAAAALAAAEDLDSGLADEPIPPKPTPSDPNPQPDRVADDAKPSGLGGWMTFWNAEGYPHDQRNAKARAKLLPLATQWTQGGVTAGQMREAIADALATAKGGIAYMPAFAAQVLINRQAPPRTAAAPRRASTQPKPEVFEGVTDDDHV